MMTLIVWLRGLRILSVFRSGMSEVLCVRFIDMLGKSVRSVLQKLLLQFRWQFCLLRVSVGMRVSVLFCSCVMLIRWAVLVGGLLTFTWSALSALFGLMWHYVSVCGFAMCGVVMSPLVL